MRESFDEIELIRFVPSCLITNWDTTFIFAHSNFESIIDRITLNFVIDFILLN